MSGQYKDYSFLIGQTVSNNIVKDIIRKNNKIYALCNCKMCGRERRIIARDLVCGHQYKCWCENRKFVHDVNFDRLYRIYHHIKDRCYNPNNDAYKNYGLKGVAMCDDWFNDFRVFAEWAMLNGYHSDLTIDRIDANGNYEPKNCRWITLSENVAKSNIDNPRKKKK